MDNRTLARIVPRLRKAVTTWEKPWVEADTDRQGKADPFRVLVACILSLRTQENTTRAASDRLFRLISSPQELLNLSETEIEQAIYPVGFYRTKARSLRILAGELLDRHGGRVPDTMEDLLALRGVGRKTANLVLSAGFGLPAICVDTHVHRITNRWGYVSTRTPEKTEWALREKLPTRYWKEINFLLVMFGQNWCGPASPRCSGCFMASECERVGVTRHR